MKNINKIFVALAFISVITFTGCSIDLTSMLETGEDAIPDVSIEDDNSIIDGYDLALSYPMTSSSQREFLLVDFDESRGVVFHCTLSRSSGEIKSYSISAFDITGTSEEWQRIYYSVDITEIFRPEDEDTVYSYDEEGNYKNHYAVCNLEAIKNSLKEAIADEDPKKIYKKLTVVDKDI